jgi:N-acetyl sugar amidotransferase
MRYCKRCVLPDTKPGVVFDEEEICSACRSVERKYTIDWEARATKLRSTCDEIRGSNGNGYECIVPVSGGKDSFTQAYLMSQVYKLRTLVVVVVPHLQTIEGIENLNSLVDTLGVDLLKISVRPSTLQKIRRIALLKVGNPNYAEHRVVFATVARAAYFYNVPLVVWGEDIGTEFGGNVSLSSANDGSAQELINNDLFRETSFDDLLEGTIPDTELFFYMNPERETIARKNIRSIYLGYYQWWDGIKHYYLARANGFKPRAEGPLPGNVLPYDNIDEKLCEVHLWFKFLKLGFWRPTDHCCYKIWNGYMTREEAVEAVNAVQYEEPAYLNEFLEYHQLTEAEYRECVERSRNLDIWHKCNGQWRLKHDLS